MFELSPVCCSLHRVPFTLGEGPMPADVMLIGEAFGWNERQQSRPFVGKSGIELRRYASRAGIEPEACRITNLYNDQPPQTANRKQLPPSRKDLLHDQIRLLYEIVSTRPRWIGAIGAHSSRALADGFVDMETSHGMAFPLSKRWRDFVVAASGDADAEETVDGRGAGRSGKPDAAVRHPRHPRQDRDSQSRPALSAEEPRWLSRVQVVPLYHPAAGLHNADVQRFVWLDLKQFADYVLGRLEPWTPEDEYPNPDYDVCTDTLERADGSWIGEGITREFIQRPRYVAIDTEGLKGSAWGLSISSAAGRARVIRRGEKQELNMLRSLLS